jgi:hypothetical protein
MRRLRWIGLAAAGLLAALPATAVAGGAQSQEEAEAIAKRLNYQGGTLAYQDARVVMPAGYRFLGQADARRTLRTSTATRPLRAWSGSSCRPARTC